MDNYQKISEEFVEEVHSKVVVYRHIKTGARVCCMENDDTNKVFCIGFRTPAINSTGLTHILEHSVLCGSKKYPVKDPFLELIKGSVNTFLNAFTFPDKTCYPVASQNSKDFKNLMSVYMDAVFYPNIYSKEEIFRQEGWRYELFDKKDPIVYNGVVYNEMKGAFSSPDDVMQREILHSLFPHNCYQYESGGDPKVIPTLTYEEFREFHKKYYSPTNSFIFLYGKMDFEERMEWMDKEYLSKFEKIDFDTEVEIEKPFDKPKEESVFYPVGEEESMDKKTQYAFAYALDNNKDAKLNMAISFLCDALVNHPGSPMKKAILDSGLGLSVDASADEGLDQTIATIIIKGADPDSKDKLAKAINSVFADAVNGKLDKKAISSYINHTELKTREGKSSYAPKGLMTILASLNYWLYDDKAASKGLKVLNLLDELREDIKSDYFERAVDKYFLNSRHESIVILSPSKTIQAEKEKAVADHLAKVKASLNEKQLEELIKSSNDLRKYQAEPSAPADIATLPKLTLDDLKEKPADYKSVLVKDGIDIYFQENETNGINYCGYYFNIDKLPNKYLPYLSLLSKVFIRLKTAKRDESELSSLLTDKTGNVGFAPDTVITKDKKIIQLFAASYSAMDRNMSDVESLIEEVVHQTVFTDTKVLYQVLCDIKNSAVSGASYSGHMVAVTRALAHKTELGYLGDIMNGLGFIDFICDLVANFEQKKDEIVLMLSKTRDIVFTKKRMFGYYTGSKEGLGLFRANADRFYSTLEEEAVPEGVFSFTPDNKSEGIKAPFDVLYNARGGDFASNGGKYTGVIIPLTNCISTEYLWMKLRVKGGAYGCFMICQDNGTLSFVSYRDPNLEQTDEVFNEIPGYMRKMEFTPDEVLKFKIGSMPTFNPVLHVSDQGMLGFKRRLRGYTYQDILKDQEELLNTTNEKMKAYADVFEKTIKDSSLVSFGDSKKIEANKDKFDIVRDFIKA